MSGADGARRRSWSMLPLGGLAWSAMIAVICLLAVDVRNDALVRLAEFGLIWIVGLAAVVLADRRIGHGIRERDRVAGELQRQENLLNTTGRMAKVGGWQLEVADRDLTWTDETFRIHGLEIGTPPSLEDSMEFYHPDDRPQLEAALERALSGGEPYDLELRLITAAGNPLWVQTVCRPEVAGDRVASLSGAVQDITERKRAELAAAEQQRKYRVLFDSATDAIFIVQEGVIRFANPATEAILGLAQEEISARPFADFIHDDDRELVVERHRERLAGGSPPDRYAFRIIDHDDHIRWVELKVEVLEWEDEVATLCFLRDITDRIEAESELERHRNHLEELVERRTAELRRTIDLMAGREVRMAELKEEVARLSEALAQVRGGRR